VILIIIKFPIAFALAFSAFAAAAYKGISLGAITQKMVSGVDSFSLLAIPFAAGSKRLEPNQKRKGVQDRLEVYYSMPGSN
jgi:hypothetical protein